MLLQNQFDLSHILAQHVRVMLSGFLTCSAPPLQLLVGLRKSV